MAVSIVVIVFLLICPSGKITDNIPPNPPVKTGRSTILSIPITLLPLIVSTDVIWPPLLTPDFTGSWISIIWPGVIKDPACIVVVNETISVSVARVVKNHFASLLAWCLEVTPKLSIVLVTAPYLRTASLSITCSYAASLNSISKYLTTTTVALVFDPLPE